MDNTLDLTVSSAPHVKSEETTSNIMYQVILALVPVMFASFYFFGPGAIYLLLTCGITAMLSEVAVQKLRGKPVTINDGSALLTGLILALTLPPDLPLWMAVFGSVVAIVLGKHIFGGLGYNVFNPALMGRAFLTLSYVVSMTEWTAPNGGVDTLSTATPLEGEAEVINLFIGRVGGSLGETSALAILLGGLYLLYKGYIDWRIPVGYLGTVAVLTTLVGEQGASFHLFAGGLMFGAIFMATDMVTSPVTKKGRWIFAIGCGFITVIIRVFGNYPEGVLFSILLMNMCVPLIDQYTLPQIYGEVKANG
ncbi:RnfABCDGE type electron transport complex subunit D [Natroniella sulfidigena]|uniref:RnfABCDGE type electron transport complex subunit D n=1 Tax=Natroniella sulfidigena TaxID=723921 RepID=UPI00200AF4D3|nr:RnfABCDGE type electron transport complex subunit D [Natroniella sulfidigena]MCK8815854.1 RnfABCDGE type electron transport complex subunit D [Natroniella sulfidigena]